MSEIAHSVMPNSPNRDVATLETGVYHEDVVENNNEEKQRDQSEQQQQQQQQGDVDDQNEVQHHQNEIVEESEIQNQDPQQPTNLPDVVVLGSSATKKGDSTRFPVNELDQVHTWHQLLHTGELSNQHGRRCISIGEKLMNYTYKQLRDLAGKFDIIVLKNQRKQDIIDQLEPHIEAGHRPSKEARRPGRRRGQTGKKRKATRIPRTTSSRGGGSSSNAPKDRVSKGPQKSPTEDQIGESSSMAEVNLDVSDDDTQGGSAIKKAKLSLIQRQRELLERREHRDMMLNVEKVKKLRIANYAALYEQYQKMLANLQAMVESKTSEMVIEGLQRLLAQKEQELDACSCENLAQQKSADTAAVAGESQDFDPATQQTQV